MAQECRGCGACCRSAAGLISLPEYWDEEKKKCIYLTEENLCEIYEDRPDICRIKEKKEYSEKMLFEFCELTRFIYRR